MNDESPTEELFAKLAAKISQATGSFWTFSAALGVVVVWAATGPIFHYSETWQLVINTGTTIITFLMVFIIQHAQNKDMRAVQLKLNELIAAVEGASNRLIDVEDLTDHELDHLYERFQRLSKTAQKLHRGAKLTIDSDSPESSRKLTIDSESPGSSPKLTNDSDSPESSRPSAATHDHAESEADKRPPAVKPEARHRKKRSPS